MACEEFQKVRMHMQYCQLIYIICTYILCTAFGRDGASQDTVTTLCQSVRFLEARLEGQQFPSDEGKVLPCLHNGHYLNGVWQALYSLCPASGCGQVR